MVSKTVLVLLTFVYVGKCKNLDYRYSVEKKPLETLELAHVIFRHGDRTPDKAVVYKNDPYKNVTYYPIGYGQLTNAGKRKEYEIGKALRKRYYDFLDLSDFRLETVDSRCTDYNRTKMSLQLVLASLLPPRGNFVWENKLNWQPVPFNYWPVEEDHVLGDPLKNCPYYIEKYFEYLNSTEGRNLYNNFSEIIRELEERTGEHLHSKALAELYFTLTTEHENGYKMPPWAEKVYKEIKHLAILDYNVSTATPLLTKLAAGFLMKKVIDDTKVHLKHQTDTKIYLYSAHEYNVAFLLRWLGIFSTHVPPYGSYILIEIHNIDGVRGFKIYYQDYTNSEPKLYHIPNCGKFCRIDQFLNLYNHLLPYSEKECFF